MVRSSLGVCRLRNALNLRTLNSFPKNECNSMKKRVAWRRRARPAPSGGRRGRTRTSATIIIELEKGHA